MPLDCKRYVCIMCGAKFVLDRHAIRSALFDGSNRPPRWRVVSTNGRVLHRCGVAPLETAKPEPTVGHT
jgi:hypothetical protein